MKTYEEVLADLRAIVQGREDYVYVPAFGKVDPNPWDNTCTYTTQDGAPSCIVGHVIAVEFPDLLPAIRKEEWYYVDRADPEDTEHEPLTEGVGSLSQTFSVTIDWEPKALALLSYVQSQQDVGTPWGEALEKAIETTEKEYAE